jgi:hypothetical protein
MPHVKPTLEEFEVKENEVIHTPTDATYTAYPGEATPHMITPGMLGSVLPNGDDYWEHEVAEIALKLLAERPQSESL